MLSRTYKVLIVAQSEKTINTLRGFFSAAHNYAPFSVRTAGEARRISLEREVDFVIINTPLIDDYGVELAMELAEKNKSVLLIVKNELYDQISYKLENYGIIILAKPLNKTAFVQAIKLLKVVQQKIEQIEVKTKTLEQKMQEIRLVNRAKWILIEQLKMSEEEAHRYIEKTAMDECVTKATIAENIIKTH